MGAAPGCAGASSPDALDVVAGDLLAVLAQPPGIRVGARELGLTLFGELLDLLAAPLGARFQRFELRSRRPGALPGVLDWGQIACQSRQEIPVLFLPVQRLEGIICCYKYSYGNGAAVERIWI